MEKANELLTLCLHSLIPTVSLWLGINAMGEL